MTYLTELNKAASRFFASRTLMENSFFASTGACTAFISLQNIIDPSIHGAHGVVVSGLVAGSAVTYLATEAIIKGLVDQGKDNGFPDGGPSGYLCLKDVVLSELVFNKKSELEK